MLLQPRAFITHRAFSTLHGDKVINDDTYMKDGVCLLGEIPTTAGLFCRVQVAG